MSLKAFWDSRVQTYYKQIVKYLKYVFNDHFILFLFILFGALAYAYSEFVKNLTPEYWILSGFTFLMLLFSLYIGELSLLLEPADQIFLTASENRMNQVMNRSRLRSIVVPGIVLVALCLAVMPLLVATGLLVFRDWLLFVPVLLLLKWAQLTLQIILFKRYSMKTKRIFSTGFFLVSFVSIGSYLYFSKIIAVILSFSLFVIFEVFLQFYADQKRFNWVQMIESEQNRKKRIYQILNLFTDVPFIKNLPARKKWADPFIQSLQGKSESLSYYILIRSFIRSSDEGSLYLRLVLVGSIIILITDALLVKGVIGLVFLALIALQMTGLSQSLERDSIHAVFGVRVDDASASLQKLLTYLVGSGSIIFGLVSLIPYEGLQNFIPFLIFIIFTFGYITFILPRRTNTRD